MRITKKKLVSVVAAAAVVGLGGTAAFAYFTAGGTGTGTAGVGTASTLSATVAVAAPDLLPNGAPHALSFTITNSATFAQHANAAVISITSVTNPGPLDFSPTGCDITLIQPVVPPGGYTFAAGQTLTINAGPGTGSLTMTDNNTNQSNCEGATVNLLGTIS